jgi:hypothetical protein
MILNDRTIKIAKDIINKKMLKNDILKYYNSMNKNNLIESDILDPNEIDELRKYKYEEYFNNFNEIMINKMDEQQYLSTNNELSKKILDLDENILDLNENIVNIIIEEDDDIIDTKILDQN